MTNKEVYISYCVQNTHHPVFVQPWWLDAVCGKSNWDVIINYNKDNAIRGLLPYYMETKYGLKQIKMPPLTPFLGPIIDYPEPNLKLHKKYSYEVEVIGQLIDNLPDNVYTYIDCNPTVKNWYPFYLKNFSQSTRYTYELTDISNIDVFKENMHQNLRKRLKKAQNTLIITDNLDSQLIFNLLESTFKVQSIKNPISEKIIQKIIEIAQTKNNINGYAAKDHIGNTHAHLVVLYDETTAYSVVLGTNPKLRQSGAAQLLYYHSIVEASARVNTYNFCGTMLPQIAPVIRPFGGKMIPYHAVSRWNNKAYKAIYTILRG